MRKFCYLLLLLGLVMTQSVKADVEINATTFPDDNFRAWVLAKVAGASDGTLTDTEIAKVKTINCSSQSIADLTGIEYFTSLTNLYCNKNSLTSLDVSALTNLQSLECYMNKLSSLNLGDVSTIKDLRCYDNKLESIDVSYLTNLTKLFCQTNQLTSLNLANNTNIIDLRCQTNKLEMLDVSNLTILDYFNCANNQLTTLNLGAVSTITSLYCQNNKLTSLDVSNATSLKTLSCEQNELTTLDVSALTQLNTFNCRTNKLTSLDVSKNTALVNLNCRSNNITSIVFSTENEYPSLTTLTCFENQIGPSINVTKLPSLVNFDCHSNHLTSLDVSANMKLMYLNCSDNPFSTPVDLTANTNLILASTSSSLGWPGDVYELTDGKYGVKVENSFDATKASNYKVSGETRDVEVITKDGQKYLVVASNVTDNLNLNSATFTYGGQNFTINMYSFLLKVTDAGMATFYNSLTVGKIIPTGMEAWYCRSINEESSIVLAYPVLTDAIPPYTGVFVTAAPGIYIMNYKASVDPLPYENILEGTATAKTVAPREVLTLGHDSNGRLGFNYFTGTEIPAYKAYIPADKVSASTSEARTFRVLFDESETTGISKLVEVNNVEDNVIYNLAGQKVNAATKGIFIKNGKKIVIK